MADYNENSPFMENNKTEREDGYKKKVFDPKIYLNAKLDEDENEREVRIRIIPAQPGQRKFPQTFIFTHESANRGCKERLQSVHMPKR